jgi:sterol desaturase/sphingolipid hydroxylase (fatty acid hydroxylase superfamily)
MKFEKIHNKGQARIFQNYYLEWLTKTHPLIIWGIYLPVIIGFPLYGIQKTYFSTSEALLVFFGGMLFWTLFEYLAHRYIFHMITETKGGRRLIYILHGNHHEFPRDKQRLFMPPVPSLIITSILFSFFYLILKISAWAFFPGFILGYLLYASMHYAIHAFAPPFPWMKPLWRNHHLHHYKDEEKGFGVSSTLWDRVFGTMFDLKKEKEDKEKVRALMFQDEAVHEP